jgi:hypothetical protein
VQDRATKNGSGFLSRNIGIVAKILTRAIHFLEEEIGTSGTRMESLSMSIRTRSLQMIVAGLQILVMIVINISGGMLWVFDVPTLRPGHTSQHHPKSFSKKD